MDGMFVNTESPAPVGTHVNLIFPAEGNIEVEVAALVVWNKGKSSYQRPGMGVQFTDIDEKAQAQLVELVEALNRNRVLPAAP